MVDHLEDDSQPCLTRVVTLDPFESPRCVGKMDGCWWSANVAAGMQPFGAQSTQNILELYDALQQDTATPGHGRPPVMLADRCSGSLNAPQLWQSNISERVVSVSAHTSSQIGLVTQAAQRGAEVQVSGASANGTLKSLQDKDRKSSCSPSSQPYVVRGQGGTRAQPESQRTTVMLRNLPNNYTRAILLSLLDSEGFAGQYDFVYLPIDFRTHAALGYAFVNLVLPEQAERLHQRLNGFSKWQFPSSKACTVSWSNPHQGLESHIARYRNSPLMHEVVPDQYRPVLLRDGRRIPFPPPTKKIKFPRQGTERMLVGGTGRS